MFMIFADEVTQAPESYATRDERLRIVTDPVEAGAPLAA
jgi:hypothetical protein